VLGGLLGCCRCFRHPACIRLYTSLHCVVQWYAWASHADLRPRVVKLPLCAEGWLRQHVRMARTSNLPDLRTNASAMGPSRTLLMLIESLLFAGMDQSAGGLCHPATSCCSARCTLNIAYLIRKCRLLMSSGFHMSCQPESLEKTPNICFLQEPGALHLGHHRVDAQQLAWRGHDTAICGCHVLLMEAHWRPSTVAAASLRHVARWSIVLGHSR
jgi:hypothetical protein